MSRPTSSPLRPERIASSVIPKAISYPFELAVVLLVSCLTSSAQSLTGVSQNLFVAGYANHNILEFTPGGVASTFASSLYTPTWLAFDQAGNLYSDDEWGGYVLKFPNTDGVLSSSPILFASGLGNPEGLAFNSAGDLFVACQVGSVIRITPGGTPAAA